MKRFLMLQKMGLLLFTAAIAFAANESHAAATTAPSNAVTPSTKPAAPAAAQGSSGESDLTSMSLEDLMNVQVTSVAKEPQKISDAPAAVTVISQDDIQRSGLGSIPELLRLAPGMDVAQINASQWAISTRGINGYLADNLLVLMDGRSVYTPVFGGVLWNSVSYPLMDLDRIESIDGPGSTLWGSNAVNGVVNIITKPSDQTQGWLIDTRGGTQQDIGDIRYGGQLDDKTYYRIYTQYQYTGNGLEANDDPAHDEWQGAQGGFRIDRYASPKDTLTLQGDAFWQQAAQVTDPLPVSTVTNYYQNGGNVLGRWSHTESDRADTSLQAYYDRQVLSDIPAGFDQDTLDIEFQNRFPLGDQQDVTWGLGARDYFIRFTPEPGVNYTPHYRNEYIYNGFVQDQISIVPNRLKWFVGTKIEYNSLTNTEIEPSTRLLFTPDDHNSLWGAYSRSSRIPSIYEDTHLDVEGIEVGTQHPGSEKSDSFEVGYKVQPIKPVTLAVSGSYNIYSDLILQVPSTTPPDQIDFANGADAYSYDAQFSADWQVLPNWRLGASYTYLSVHAHTIINSPIDQFIPPYQVQFIEGSSPENQFQIHSYVDLLKNLQFNTSLYYVDNLPLINAVLQSGQYQSVNGYFRLDMNIRWMIKPNMTVAVGVQNLLQNKHFESGSVDTQALPTAVPRTFYADFTMTF